MTTSANRAHFVRAAFSALSSNLHRSAEEFCASKYPGDAESAAVLRAAVSPATAGDHSSLVSAATRDFLSTIQDSAASRLMRDSVPVTLDGAGSTVHVPYDADSNSGAGWVSETAAIPIVEGATGRLTVGPSKKLGVAAVVTRETIRRPDGERIFGNLLRARLGRALDVAVLSASDPGPDGHPGLLHGVPQLDAEPLVSMAEALGALSAALADAGGGGRIMIVASAADAAKIELELPSVRWPILASRALQPGHIVAADPGGLAFGVGGEVDLLRSNDGVVHMANPAEPIVDGSTAAPVVSIWQNDAIALRALLDLAWGAKPGAIQHVQVDF